MEPVLLTTIVIIVILGALALYVFLYAKNIETSYNRLKNSFDEREKELERKLYELSVLKEIGERIGYSLNVQKVAEIITGSLGNLVSYSTSSYILVLPDKIVFRIYLKRNVSRKFIDEVKKRMLESLFVLVGDDDLIKLPLDEGLSGELVDDTKIASVGSFFNIPLVIGNKVMGLINIASSDKGLYKEEDMNILYRITEKASNAVTKLQEILESEKSKVEATVESMYDGVLMVDKNLVVQITNPAFRKFLNLEKSDITIFNIIEEFAGKLKLKEKIEESIRKDILIIEPEIRIGDSFYQVLISPVKSGVEILGAVVLLRDITEQKSLEKMREEFSSMMVHDLRAPLSVIYGTSDLLLKRESTLQTEKKVELLFQIKKSSSSMLDIVNKLLDIAKLESGGFKPNKKMADINSLLRSQGKYFSVIAKDRGISIRYDIKGKIEFEFDGEMITRVINNLISNAIKYTKEKGTITIGSRVDRGSDSVIVYVKDTGVGIPEDKKDVVFSKFKQIRNPIDPSEKGTGLGLVIAKGIIEAHGGNIWFESKEGKGSKFTFALPMYKDNNYGNL